MLYLLKHGVQGYQICASPDIFRYLVTFGVKYGPCFILLNDSAREALSGLSKAFPRNKNRLSDLELPVNFVKEIAEKLPQDKTQMMKIDQMTDFRFQIFGTQFLTICKKYINFSESSKRARKSIESIKDVIEECPVCLNIGRSKTI